MAKPKLSDYRNDFRGGRNTSTSPDKLEPNELIDATNARLQNKFGAFSKRSGSRRMHGTEIGAGNAVRGVFQWTHPTLGAQTVAVANGNFYSKTTEFGNFTQAPLAAADALSTTAPAYIFPFRDKETGAPLSLYVASGGKYYRWDGINLFRLDTVTNVSTTNALQHNTRVFATVLSQPKHIFWSKVGKGGDFAIGGITDGGNGLVDVLSGDEIVGLSVVGDSLLIATNDSISRFTGYSADDIQIASDTRGISPDVGVVGGFAILRIERYAAFLSDRGPYIATESDVQQIGEQVETDFADLDPLRLPFAVIGHHKGRREVWFAVDNTVYVWNYRINGWYGPFIYPFNIVSMSRFERNDGTENLMAGCSDGYVRLMDIDSLDDTHWDGSNGQNIGMQVEPAPHFYNVGPSIEKSAFRVDVDADLPVNSELIVESAFDTDSFNSYSVTPRDTAVQTYRVDVVGNGGRQRIRFIDNSAEQVIIHGYTVHAYNMQRPARYSDNV